MDNLEYLRNNLLIGAQSHVDLLEEGGLKGKISDGYHTFDELYEFRKVYNAALFNEWANSVPDEIIGESEYGKYRVKYNPEFDGKLTRYGVHKSWKHHNGELCFGGGWFIVMAKLPTGQISNHYEAKDWDLFRIPETEKALFEYDGHTPQDVINRLKELK